MIPFLCNVSKNYLQYLEENDKGYELIKIHSIAQNIFGLTLHLEYKIKSLESLTLRTSLGDFYISENTENEENKISIGAWDEKHRVLYLNMDSNLKEKLFKAKDSITLLSDLRFLVKNVLEFFESDPEVCMPQLRPTIAPNIDSLKELQTPPNDDQLNALKGIFSHSLSYIWGVAGSGKTKVVLLHALAFYLKENRKVAILAPTNNALEQCLGTLIVNLEQIGYETKNIIRFGTPSQSFAENFPNNCEVTLRESQRHKQIMQEMQIVALTLDNFIKRQDLLNLKFSHFFVDEAAFAPLIKILPLCKAGIPLTLLGDHKQLQPICVLSDADCKNPKWKLSTFWQYSALFVECFLNYKDNFSNFLQIPKQNIPQISNQFSLKKTYRYGDNLAKLLDSYIYKNNLEGLQSTTQIYHLHVDSKDFALDKANPKEAAQCCFIAKDFLSKNVEFAILTPFVNQRSLILKTFPTLYSKECVFTIHASQGQEFDYVIFSPVILHYHLNDSKNPNALFALNVALSRAKKGIILVCDMTYWTKLQGQFLSDLARISQPFSSENIV